MKIIASVFIILGIVIGTDNYIQNKHIQQFDNHYSILKDGVIVDRYTIGSIDQYKLN